MKSKFRMTKRTLATAVMVTLLSCGVMGTGFAAIEGISYTVGTTTETITPDSSGYISVADIMDKGGLGALGARLVVTENLLAGDWKGYTVKQTIDITNNTISNLETSVHGKISAVSERVTQTEAAIKTINDETIPAVQQNISDLQSGKLDKATFEAYKTETAATVSLMNDAINATAQAVTDLETAEDAKITALDGRVTNAENAIATNVTDISDLQSGKLDIAVYEADKEDTKTKLDGKANVALDNITEEGKTVIKDLARGAVDVVGDGPVSVAKSDVGGVDTYTVSVKTDGKVESGDTGIVTGGTVYTSLQNETHVTADGNYIEAADSAAKNLEALDTQVKKNEDAIGTTADGNYVKSSNSVGDNLGALDTQIAALAGGTGAGLAEVSHRIDNMDSKINKVGAGAAALAALHPMDTDGKFSMAAGFGNYRDANAMALGVFYRPNDQVMFSMGGSLGNGENLLNVGVSFALDKGVSTSKAAMARTIKAQGEKISEQDAKIQTLEAENAKLAERLAAIEAKLGK